MGKKRIIRKAGGTVDQGLRSRSLSRVPKKRLERGKLFVIATFNNTIVSLADALGNVVVTSSSGALGFKGTKKSTPYAAAKVGELIGDKALLLGVKEVDVIIRGVGSGRESALRSFAGKGVGLRSIADKTPVPFNGPKARKPRRV